MENLAENSKFSKTLPPTTGNLWFLPNDLTKNQSALQNDQLKQTNNCNFRICDENQKKSGNSILTNSTIKNLWLLPNDLTNQSTNQDDLRKHTNFSNVRNRQDNRINWVIPKVFRNLVLYSEIPNTSRSTLYHKPRSTYWKSLPLTNSVSWTSLLDRTTLKKCPSPSGEGIDTNNSLAGEPPASSTITQNMEVDMILGGRDAKDDV